MCGMKKKDIKEKRIKLKKAAVTEVIAHRGASALAPHENTLESFRLAIDIQADMVEFDVRCTHDKKLVVIHDSTFNEMPVSYQTYEDMNRKAEEEGFRIPTFEEVVELCAGRIFMDIEVKAGGFEKELIRILHKYCDYDQYSVKSFFDPVVARIKKLDPKITTGLLLGKDHPGPIWRMKEVYPIKRLRKAGCDFVAPFWIFSSRGFVWRMHRKGYPVYVWTVNTPGLIGKLIKRGVDGVITDRPDIGLSVRSEIFHGDVPEHAKGIHRTCVDAGRKNCRSKQGSIEEESIG